MIHLRRALRRLAWWLHLVNRIDETHRYRRKSPPTTPKESTDA